MPPQPAHGPRSPRSLWELPSRPAVYALIGDAAAAPRIAFIGVAESLLERVFEQLVVPGLRLRSAGGGLAVQPGYLSELQWWEHADFHRSEALRAAEFVASDLLEPMLTTRRPSTSQARMLHEDDCFRSRMRALFAGKPTGTLRLVTFADLLERLEQIEQRLDPGDPGAG